MRLNNIHVTWDDIHCKYLDHNPSDLEQGQKSCMLASKLAGTTCSAIALNCSNCTALPNSQKPENIIVQTMAKKAAKEKGIKTLESYENKLGEGVGTELHRMIPKFLEKPGCKCKDMARKMNIWGPDGCENNRTLIVNHLSNKAEKIGFLSWVPKSATRMVVDRMLTSVIAKVRNREDGTENKWYCAVTTAPREIPTLDTCLDSLEICGFKPFIFAEPNSPKPHARHEEFIIQNEERRGVWWNWIDSLKYGIENTDANIFLTVQDDSMFHPDCKAFAEKILWPDDRTGFVSLYTPKHYNIVPKFKTKTRPIGINRIYSRALWGACAMIWPRAVVEAMLEHPFLDNWHGASTKTKTHWEKIKKQRKEEPWRIQNSDTGIGHLMNRMERSMWFVDPSPVNHVALTSAIGHGDNAGRRNCGRCADWNSSLFDQVPIVFTGRRSEEKIFTHDEIVVDIPEK